VCIYLLALLALESNKKNTDAAERAPFEHCCVRIFEWEYIHWLYWYLSPTKKIQKNYGRSSAPLLSSAACAFLCENIYTGFTGTRVQQKKYKKKSDAAARPF
jgi:hypothetical protein